MEKIEFESIYEIQEAMGRILEKFFTKDEKGYNQGIDKDELISNVAFWHGRITAMVDYNKGEDNERFINKGVHTFRGEVDPDPEREPVPQPGPAK